ncbi:DMT family transporter [Chitinibacter tainanensis]|uniref:DMT family transporter n=1 Tax=Chitinibacter tainanensis TaxID=230667 RepID=UPI0023566617|nr:DMT family transporter [Chitinibacter tainanensis]
MQASRRAGQWLVVFSAIAFGWMPIFGSWAYQSGVNTQGLLLVRFTLAAAVMIAVMFWRGGRWPRGKVLLGLAAMGALGYVGQAYSYFSALQYGSAALAALLLYAYPVLVTLVAVIWGGERLGGRKLLALALAAVSLILTIGPAGGQWLGVLLGLLAAAIYTGYILAGSRLTPQAGAMPAATVVMSAAALALWLTSAWQTPVWPGSHSGWLALLAIALVSTVGAILAFLAGLERLPASEASMLSTLEPVVSVLLAAALLGDQLSGWQLLGGVGILISALLIATAKPIPRVATVELAAPESARDTATLQPEAGRSV